MVFSNRITEKILIFTKQLGDDLFSNNSTPIEENPFYKKRTTYNNDLKLYLPFEDLAYGFSIMLHPSKEINTHRLIAFFEVIENFILSDKVVVNFTSNKIDSEILKLIDEFHINDCFDFDYEFPNYSFNEYLTSALSEDIKKSKNKLTYFFKEINKNILIKNARLALKKKDNPQLDYLIFTIRTLAFDGSEDRLTRQLNFIRKYKLHTLPVIGTGINIILGSIYATIISTASLEKGALDLVWYPNFLKASSMLREPIFAPSNKIFLNKINDKKYADFSLLNDFLYKEYNSEFQTPILINYLISKASNFRDLFDICLELKESRELKDYKNWCNSIDYYLKNGNQNEALGMIKTTEKEIKSISRKFNTGNIPSLISYHPNLQKTEFNINENKNLIFLRKMYYETLSPIVLDQKLINILKKM